MNSIIICTHGDLGAAMKDSVEMIFGQTNELYPISFHPGENTEDLLRKIDAVIQERYLKNVLIFVDLFAGSPYNAASMLAMKNSQIEVIAGVNLGICLEAISNKDSKSLKELVDYLKQIAPLTVKSFRDFINDEEDELE